MNRKQLFGLILSQAFVLIWYFKMILDSSILLESVIFLTGWVSWVAGWMLVVFAADVKEETTG